MTESISREWDDNTLQLHFQTPLTDEQRLQLVKAIEQLFNVELDDSYECYELATHQVTGQEYLYGSEKFCFR